jgi:hypothetical protein
MTMRLAVTGKSGQVVRTLCGLATQLRCAEPLATLRPTMPAEPLVTTAPATAKLHHLQGHGLLEAIGP